MKTSSISNNNVKIVLKESLGLGWPTQKCWKKKNRVFCITILNVLCNTKN